MTSCSSYEADSSANLLTCGPSWVVSPSTAVGVRARCEDALGSISDDEVAVGEVIRELAAMSSGGFGGLGGARGMDEDDGLVGDRL